MYVVNSYFLLCMYVHTYVPFSACILNIYVNTVCIFTCTLYIFIYYNADVPNGVTNVRIRDDITNESFVVLWDEVMDIFTITYNVTWYDESSIIGMDTVNSPPYTVTGLTINTSYNVTVVPINTCGAGPVSVTVEVITNMREPTSSPTDTPGNVTVCTYICSHLTLMHARGKAIILYVCLSVSMKNTT